MKSIVEIVCDVREFLRSYSSENKNSAAFECCQGTKFLSVHIDENGWITILTEQDADNPVVQNMLLILRRGDTVPENATYLGTVERSVQAWKGSDAMFKEYYVLYVL